MRAVVAVLLFVTAAHAALWGLFQEKQPAPDFRGILPSVSYAPFEPGHTVADGDTEKVRADLKKLSTLTRAVRLHLLRSLVTRTGQRHEEDTADSLVQP